MKHIIWEYDEIIHERHQSFLSKLELKSER